MGLRYEGMDRIRRANDLRLSAGEIKQVKTLLGEEYLEKVLEKGLEGSTEEEVESLKKLCENLFPPYPGTMQLVVDARDYGQGIIRISQTIPVAKAGKMTLLYPEWLPGNHAPRGEIEKLVALKFSAGGQDLPWVRDAVDVFAFHVDVPEGTSSITAEFQFVSATRPSQGRVVIAPSMLNLRWHQVSLYPAGYYTRQIPVQATAIYPDGWQAATSLRPETREASTYRYKLTDYDTLVDSPVFAGKYFQKFYP